MMRVRHLSILAAFACVVLTPASAGAAKRFHGDVAGAATGPGHSFVVGDGLYLRFIDFRKSDTRYRVCYQRRGSTHRTCHEGVTGRAGRVDKIFIAAPGRVGPFIARWHVHGRVVSSWSWYNGVGD